MKITINITKEEIAGIRDYLKEVDDLEKVTAQDIQRFIQSYVDIINSPREAVSNYINKYRKYGI